MTLSRFACSPVSTARPARPGCLCCSPAFARVNALVERRFVRRGPLAGPAASSRRKTPAAAGGLAAASASVAPGAAPGKPIAFTNVRVFDGKSDALRDGLTVIVEGDAIRAVEDKGNPPGADMEVIDGGGRTLTPGLIDAHWHAMMAAMPLQQLLTADIGYINIVAADQAEKTLMRGFTTVRDMAGPAFGLKRAIDSGLIAGPRIWPSGAMISQTGGHGDFRLPYEVPAPFDAPLSHGETLGGGMIADGVPQVLKRVREQLMLGASQVKLAAGGGVSSNYDPLDVSQFTEDEFRAAVEAAENWGTYVTVHAYTPRAIQTAIRAGVRCIEHGQLMDEETAKIIADKGVWLSAQPFLNDEDATPFPPDSPSFSKQLDMTAGTDRAYGFAKAYKIKTAWGTDTLFDAKLAMRQGAQLAKMKRWYSPVEILKMATGTNGELVAMAGPRNPYPRKIGVIEPGAYADLLLIDGDPTTDIDLVANPANLIVIMKDGRLFRNALA